MTAEAPRHNVVKMLDEPDTLSLYASMQRLSAQWRDAYRAEMARRGFAWHLTAAGDLLEHVTAAPISQSDLTTASGLTKQAVQQLLDQLEAQSVLRRMPDPADRRAKRIELTDLGLSDLAARAEVTQALDADVRDRLGKKPAKKLRKAIHALLVPMPQTPDR